MCERCAELEERVAWLEGELELQRRATDHDRLRTFLRAQLYGAPRGVDLVLAMYRAGGRVMSALQLMDAVPPISGGDDERNPKIIEVWVCHLRKALGRECIATAYGKGYRLTEVGLARVAEILGHSSATDAEAVAA